jgi:hypothetical protein
MPMIGVFLIYLLAAGSVAHSVAGSKTNSSEGHQKDKLSDLVDLNLIRIIGTTKQKKGTGLVDLYEHTLPGYLMALLIKANQESRERTSETIERVLRIIHTYTKTNDSCSLLFINKFLRNCATKGSFLAIVDFFMEAILPTYTLSDSGLEYRTLEQRTHGGVVEWDMYGYVKTVGGLLSSEEVMKRQYSSQE